MKNVRTPDGVVHVHGAADMRPTAPFDDGTRYAFLQCLNRHRRRICVAAPDYTDDPVTCIACLSNPGEKR